MGEKTLTRKNFRQQLDAAEVPAREDLVIRIPSFATTLTGFRAWCDSEDFPEQANISFIDGEVTIDISQEEFNTYLLVKAAIVKTFMTINDDEDLGTVIPDGGRITNEAANVSNNPDAGFVSYETLESKKAIFIPRPSDADQTLELVGSPDLVVEIVSNSSVRKDCEKLLSSYHLAGIAEYWLIDARGEEISFQILSHRRAGFAAAANHDGWIRSHVLRREFRLTRLKDRMGMWKYRLESRTSGRRKK